MKLNLSQQTKIILAFFTLYTVWGSTFLAILIALQDTPPFLVGAVRNLLAGVILCLFHLRTWRYNLSRSEWTRIILIGLLLPCLGNGLLIWAEQTIPSGTASVLLTSVPIWVLLINWGFFEKRKPGYSEIGGSIFGILGVYVLSSDQSDSTSEWVAVGLLLFGAICWSIGSLIQRSARFSVSNLQVSALQMAFGGGFLMFFSLLAGEWNHPEAIHLTWRWSFAVVYLAVIGSVIGFSAYTWLLGAVHPQKVATYALVNPLVALTLGAVFANEVIHSKTLVAASLVLGGVALILFKPHPKGPKAPKSPRKRFPFKIEKLTALWGG